MVTMLFHIRISHSADSKISSDRLGLLILLEINPIFVYANGKI